MSSAREYVRAFRKVGEADARRQQLVWINELVDLLDRLSDGHAQS